MSTTSVDEERQRKRLRKGTFSCWECKRRKVRCKYGDDSSICTGCIARGATCLSQEYPEDHKAIPDTSSFNMGDRLARVEKVLEKLVNKIGATEDSRINATEASESLGIDVLHQSTTHENAPIFSLFDNAVFGRSKNDEEKPAGYASSMPTPISLPDHSTNSLPSKLETTSRYLVAILPRQETVDLIIEAGHGWWIVRQHEKPLVDQLLLTLDCVHLLSKRHPIIVARALLYLVILIQQLPSSFDRSKLEFSSTALTIEKYHTAVSTRVLMDDELIGSIEGIECLILQCIYHSNAARPRSAWLSIRRAINICLLLGIHRKSGRLSKESEAMSAAYLEEVWCLVVAADRYIALLLGLPYGVSDSHCDYILDISNPTASTEERYQRKLISISGEIIDRNSAPPDFEVTQDIDRRLDELEAMMPQAWWQLPQESMSSMTSLGFGRTQNSSALFDVVMVQIWHFQLRALLHLPFMLRSEQRYEKSKMICLEASRKLIKRYIFFRKSYQGCFSCEIVNFQAFISATTLLLDLLGPIPCRDSNFESHQKDNDWRLVQDVTQVFENILRGTPENTDPDVVATQGLKVLKALQANQDCESNMKLAIPYFGTVSISRSPRPTAPNPKVSTLISNSSQPSNFPQNSNITQMQQPTPYQQHQQHQQVFNLAPHYLAQQPYSQQFPVVSFADDATHRPGPENESLWGDWLLQPSNDVPFQNMFDNPNIGTSWYL